MRQFNLNTEEERIVIRFLGEGITQRVFDESVDYLTNQFQPKHISKMSPLQVTKEIAKWHKQNRGTYDENVLETVGKFIYAVNRAIQPNDPLIAWYRENVKFEIGLETEENREYRLKATTSDQLQKKRG